MESKPKMLKYLNEDSNKYKFQVELEQNEEPNFVFYSFSYFSTSFGTFAYNNKYQEVNFSGKLKYNAEKGYYELNINKARQESRDVSILGFSSGPIEVWEGESFEKVLDKLPIRFYNDSSSRFSIERNPEPTVILTKDNAPQFCKFEIQQKLEKCRLGSYWLTLTKANEGSCLIY
jgi:hypothetical protein